MKPYKKSKTRTKKGGAERGTKRNRNSNANQYAKNISESNRKVAKVEYDTLLAAQRLTKALSEFILMQKNMKNVRNAWGESSFNPNFKSKNANPVTALTEPDNALSGNGSVPIALDPRPVPDPPALKRSNNPQRPQRHQRHK